ncbi:5-carboxymethyl-2-hydroxymuconate Delta-isomerase [Parahaliea mediterranea]|uniref:5-carboxymethyl-2-hydroxymuconate Delta-isomerase n=1 Tax=Parahaliea mediterranea TaxID=651086 RepID=UPI000E2E4577|nr:5-carboxymethyl-2-hydroxymuconate Delta-isomerase [Parahaliea mediterranea]
MHFVLEYSDNVEPDTLAPQVLFAALHDCAVATGLFPLKGIRSRAYACHDYRLADGNPAHRFVHLTALIGSGRSDEEKEAAARALYAVYERHFDGCFDSGGMALSFEMKELAPALKYNRNNIDQHLEAAS